MKPVIKATGRHEACYKGYRVPRSLLKRLQNAMKPVIKATGCHEVCYKGYRMP